MFGKDIIPKKKFSNNLIKQFDILPLLKALFSETKVSTSFLRVRPSDYYTLDSYEGLALKTQTRSPTIDRNRGSGHVLTYVCIKVFVGIHVYC